MSNLGNKKTMSQNLQNYIAKSGKNRKDICDDLEISYSTFNDWVAGRVYPRIDKIEAMANYFGISKSDLIEDFSEFAQTQKATTNKYDFLITMGNRIKSRRESLNLTQGELAEITGYSSHSSVAKIEMGLVDLSQSKIKIIADALKTTPATLLGDDVPSALSIPDKYKDVAVAFAGGTEDLTQNDIDDIVRFIEFVKNKKN